MSGPLTGVRVVEMAGIGPTPFSGMMLSDLGAEVTRIDRIDRGAGSGVMDRGKTSIAIDLKSADGVEVALDVIAGADVLVEGFRAGVMERLGLGPDVCLGRNPKLVYARMTGWGQTGPLAETAGHDINYISLAGPLAHIGRHGDAPAVPLNLIGDFGGGSLFCVAGICAALVAVANGHPGQVIDAAMVDGAAYLLSPMYAAHASGFWTDERGTNMLDSGAPFYDVYECADGEWISVGAIEPQFHAVLLDGLGIDPAELPTQMDRSTWPEVKERFAAAIRSRPRSAWIDIFDGSDACVAPVLGMGEAPEHPHAAARDAFVDWNGTPQPAPAPRFSATPAVVAGQGPEHGGGTRGVLAARGYEPARIDELITAGTIRATDPADRATDEPAD